MLMDSFPDDAVLQAIAAENNQAETAFGFPKAATMACAGSHLY